MFTGIIQGLGEIREIEKGSRSGRITVETSMELQDLRVGDSISVNGACLTITDIDAGSFKVTMSSETIEKTTFSRIERGKKVNLEKALKASDFIGGHWVTGHVEGCGVIIRRSVIGDSVQMGFRILEELQRFVVKKGSITIDGVSLTVNDLIPNGFEVNLIPYTLESTTFPLKQEGDEVNIETDIMGRYVERFLTYQKASKGVDMDFLAEHGFS